jgi:hypothetical protein
LFDLIGALVWTGTINYVKFVIPDQTIIDFCRIIELKLQMRCTLRLKGLIFVHFSALQCIRQYLRHSNWSFLDFFNAKAVLTRLVPHSQSSLRENPKFLQNFRPKNNTLRKNI